MPTTYPVRRTKPKPGDYVHLNGGERYAIISEWGGSVPLKSAWGGALPMSDMYGNNLAKTVRIGWHLQSVDSGHLTSIRAKSLMIDGNVFEDNSSDIPLF